MVSNNHLSGSIRVIIISICCLFIMLSGWTFPDHENTGFLYSASADSFCDTLSNGLPNSEISFGSSGGSNTGAQFSLPKSCEILSATFNVTGTANVQNEYPTDVKIDVGDDGDFEWEFNLSGAGSLGRQTEFLGPVPYKLLKLDKGEYDNSPVIRLPRTANVLAANMDVIGYSHGVTNGNFSTGTMLGWTTVTNTNSDTIVVQNTRGGNNPAAGWGADGNYLMLMSNPYGGTSHDINCDIVVESDPFPKLHTTHITMDWDVVENDDFDLYIRIQDENNNNVQALRVGNDNNNDNTDSQIDQVIDVSSLPGSYLNVRLRLWDGGQDWPWNTRNNYGRLCVDEIFISDSGGNSLPNYPTDVSVDIGNDGLNKFERAILQGTNTFSGLREDLNALLANPSPGCQVTVDDYGNEYLDIPINVSILSSQGIVNITNMEILYEYDAVVNKNPRGDLADELNSLIPSSGTGNVTIPIAVSSSTGGEITISEINIKYNAAPVATTIPTIEILEDSLNPKKIDLDEYFSDDSYPEQLVYELASHSAPDKLEAYIENDHFLTVNANQLPDWNGDVKLLIRASDYRNLQTESNKFTVRVNPVNDEPRVNLPLKKITLLEDSSGTSLSLDEIPYFIDIEDDILYYLSKVDPMGVLPGSASNLSVTIDDDNNLLIKPNPNWNGYNIPVWIYCDDDNDPINIDSTSPLQILYIDVIPVNDPPELIPFDTLYLDEDESIENYLSLYDRATDLETPTDLLKFSIISNDNEENILVKIDEYNNLDITSLKQDYVGSAKVKIQVRDEEGVTAEESLNIIINSINDGPRIISQVKKIQMLEDTVDSTSVNLHDVFYDPDSPISYIAAGNNRITVIISQYNGTVTFKPDRNWNGMEDIIFTALDSFIEMDGSQQKAMITVNVTVIPVNDPPSTPTIISPEEHHANPSDSIIEFKAEEAVDVDNSELHYYFDFDNRVDRDGDGDPTNDREAVGRKEGDYIITDHKYPTSGYYYVTLIVSDGDLNCSTPAGIYVKVTTNYNKVTKEVAKEVSSTKTDVLLWLPFIIIIIALVLMIILKSRKAKKKEPKEDADKIPKEPEKPQVLEGELISSPKSPVSESLPKPAVPVPILPQIKDAEPAAGVKGTEQTKSQKTQVVKPTPTPEPAPQPSPTPTPAPEPAPAKPEENKTSQSNDPQGISD